MMTSSSRIAVGLVVALMAAPYASDAHAQQQAPSAQALETARSLFREGKDLRARGDVRGALEKLRAAHALGNTPVTGIELARTYVLAGHLMEARALCLSVVRMPVAPDETEKSAGARAEAAQLAGELRTRIATLVVQVDGLASSEIAHVAIDGVAVSDDASREPQKLDPGPHDVTARAGEASAAREVHGAATLEEGETKKLTLEMTPPPAAPTPAPSPVTLPAPEPPLARHGRGLSVLKTAGFATAVAGGAVGVVAGILALDKKGKLADECNQQRQCDASRGGSSDLAQAQSWATVSTVTWSLGAAGLVVGVVALLAAREDRPPPREGSIAPWIGAGVAGVHGRF